MLILQNTDNGIVFDFGHGDDRDESVQDRAV